MNIKLTNFSIRKMVGGRRRLHQSTFMNPAREWLTGLMVATFVFVFGALSLGFEFWTQYHNVDILPVVDESVVRYRATDEAYFLTVYREREEQFKKLRADRSYASIPAEPLEEVLPEPSIEEGNNSIEPLADEVVEQ